MYKSTYFPEELPAGKWLNEEMISEFMKEKNCERQRAIDILSLIPEEQPKLSKKDMEYAQKRVQQLIDKGIL